jgi:hypothetical protein
VIDLQSYTIIEDHGAGLDVLLDLLMCSAR